MTLAIPSSFSNNPQRMYLNHCAVTVKRKHRGVTASARKNDASTGNDRKSNLSERNLLFSANWNVSKESNILLTLFVDCI